MMVPSSPRAFAPFIKPVMVELTVFWTISEGVERASINLIKICDTWRSRRRGGSDRRRRKGGKRQGGEGEGCEGTCKAHQIYCHHLRYTLHSTLQQTTLQRTTLNAFLYSYAAIQL